MLGALITFLPLFASDPGAPSISWADKLTAFGTVGAVVATLGITLTTHLRTSRERRIELAERTIERRMSQARQVHWWLEPCPEHVPVWDGDDYGAAWLSTRALEDCWGSRLVVENRSEFPIHDVLPVMTLRIALHQTYGDRSIGPGGRVAHHLSGDGECLLDMIHAPRPHLLFRDAQGHAWRRGEHGALNPVDDSTDLADIEIKLSSAAFRMISANYREDQKRRESTASIQRVFVPLTNEGLDNISLEQLAVGDSVAFKMLQEMNPRRLERELARAWWSWRAKRTVEKRLEVERWIKRLS